LIDWSFVESNYSSVSTDIGCC